MSSNDIFIRNSDTPSDTPSDNINTSDIELIESQNTEEVNIMLNILFNQNNDTDSGYYSE